MNTIISTSLCNGGHMLNFCPKSPILRYPSFNPLFRSKTIIKVYASSSNELDTKTMEDSQQDIRQPNAEKEAKGASNFTPAIDKDLKKVVSFFRPSSLLFLIYLFCFKRHYSHICKNYSKLAAHVSSIH